MMSAEDRTAAVGESPAEGENPAERKTPAEGRTSPDGSWLEQAPPLSTRTGGLAFRLYKQILSPVLHTLSFSQCLYRPTCSEYAYVAIARFGAARGCWLALRRVLRCHPWAHGGFDPVPDVASRSRAEAADHLR